jgi:uroporphyrinogen-III decarboxylase
VSSFLSAAWGADTPTAPIWLMRQVGRYLPEYRKLKERYGFWRMCRTPEIAAEVTLQPVRRFPLDAAILFNDIMTPLPLAAYLVQGGGSADYLEFRTWLLRNPGLARELLDKLTDVTIGYLRMQVGAGAQAIQIFDSWAGIHHERGYAAFGLPYAARVLDALGGLGVPRAMPGKVIQGNLDPAVLLADGQVIDTATVQLLRDGLGGAHIFNLGHGVLPATPPGAVARLVDAVHRFSRAPALAEASTQHRSEERSFQSERSPGSPRE